MARKKKSEVVDILENGLKDRNLVQKSRPLFSLWESGLTLGEFKILDTYLARIDSHNPDAREVHFTKGDLEAALGVDRIRQDVLEERLKHLMGTVVKINDGRKNQGFTMITLFSMAVADKNKDTDLWDIKLRCTEEAKEYFFNIDQIGYLRYKIGVVTKLNSVYSYILFQYLEYNRFRVEWDEGLTELKNILHCTGETYNQFYRFNERVLKQCFKEITQKTACKFSYTPIKKGRKVVGVHFAVETMAAAMPEQMPQDQQMEFDDLGDPNDPTALYRCAIPDLSREEQDLIITDLLLLPEHKLPQIDGGIEIQRYHYLLEKWAVLMIQDKKKPIRNKCSYLSKMIKKDIQS